MPFPLAQYALVSLILFASSVIQGSVGFAAGLFGIPLLTLTGLPLPDAVAISFIASAVQACIPCWQLRREIDMRLACGPCSFGLPRYLWASSGSPVEEANNDVANQLVGFVVLGILVLQQTWGVMRVGGPPPAWEWAAFGVGGFLTGFCGMGGPLMVLWVLAYGWSMNRSRAFMYFIFQLQPAVAGRVAVAGVWLQDFARHAAGSGRFACRASGAVCGALFGRLLPDQALRRLSVLILVLIAASAILRPMLH